MAEIESVVLRNADDVSGYVGDVPADAGDVPANTGDVPDLIASGIRILATRVVFKRSNLSVILFKP